VGRGAAPKSKLAQRSVLIPTPRPVRGKRRPWDLLPWPGGCPGVLERGRNQGGTPLAPSSSRAAGRCVRRFVGAEGGHKMNHQPQPRAKRLPRARSAPTATRQRSWPRGSRDAGTPSTRDRREAGTQPARGRVHPRPLRAALTSTWFALTTGIHH